MDVRATGKSRSQRINIDYYRQSTWISRSRGLLALVAALGAGGYCFYVFASGSPAHLSTGPVAAAHAAFEKDCQQCHLDFTPISADALRFSSSESLDRIEEACQVCHRVDHHFRGSLSPQFAAVDQHCSGCHTDHQGRDHDMANVHSKQCTQCHGNLTATCTSPFSLEVRANVTAFSLEAHGDFASIADDQRDPGRIKFDHAQHMSPGQVDAGIKGGFTIAMLEESFRQAYRKTVDGEVQSDDALVTLSCTDCHQFAGVPATAAVGDNEVGRHIAPIRFEQHCAACHSLNHLRASEASLPLPHAAPWKEIETLIASKVVGGQQLGDIRMPRDVIRKTPLVGEGQSGPLLSSTAKPGEGEDKAILEAAVSAGRAEVHKRCLQCHQEQDITDESIADLRSQGSPPLIPERWLVRGIYDHAAHRKVDCKFCHAEAYPAAGPSSDPGAATNDPGMIMIGGIETCTGCHRDAEVTVPAGMASAATKELLGGQSTWASAACIECHRYHWQRPSPGDMSQSAVVSAENPTQ